MKEQTAKNLFVIVPQHIATGPVKGAIAICNYLCDYLPVTFVSVKTPVRLDGSLRPEVCTLSLAEGKGLLQRTQILRKTLKSTGTKDQNVTLSMCFAADVVNLLAAGLSTRIASVRGNLLRNYASEYGPAGFAFAILHIFLLHGMDLILTMSGAMTRQLRCFGHFHTMLVRNFIDEDAAERDVQEYPVTPSAPPPEGDSVVFGFLGSLTRRKRPELVIQAIAYLQRHNIPSSALMVGSGPLKADLMARAQELGVENRIHFVGQLINPLPELKRCAYLLLPSSSEGIPRAALESLYIGVPCILRDVDANRELIHGGGTGVLFKDDKDLDNVVMQVARSHVLNRLSRQDNLLPGEYRQSTNCNRLLEIINHEI